MKAKQKEEIKQIKKEVNAVVTKQTTDYTTQIRTLKQSHRRELEDHTTRHTTELGKVTEELKAKATEVDLLKQQRSSVLVTQQQAWGAPPPTQQQAWGPPAYPPINITINIHLIIETILTCKNVII